MDRQMQWEKRKIQRNKYEKIDNENERVNINQEI